MFEIGDIVVRTVDEPSNWCGRKAEIIGDPSGSFFGNWKVKLLDTGTEYRWNPKFFKKHEEVVWEV